MIFARRSVRKYQDKPLSDEVLRDLLEAAMAAPSAAAKDPWHFVVLRQKPTLARIAEGLPNGRLLAEAAAGVVVCGDRRKAHGNEESYLLQDCSAAIENLLLAASALGLGACWLGVHPRAERMAYVGQALKLPEGIVPVGVVALGWPAEHHPPRTRFTEAVIHDETW